MHVDTCVDIYEPIHTNARAHTHEYMLYAYVCVCVYVREEESVHARVCATESDKQGTHTQIETEG